MRPQLQCLLLAMVLTHCGPPRPRTVGVSSGSRPATKVGTPRVGWLLPEDAVDGVLRVEVGGPTLLVFASNDKLTQVSVREATGNAPRPLRPLQFPPLQTAHFGSMPPATTTAKVHHSIQVDTKGTKIEASLAFAGARFALYTEDGETSNISTSEWQALDASLEEGLAPLTDVFGMPTDRDGDGRINVAFSYTARGLVPNALAYVDGCHVVGGCTPAGEWISVWSPNAMAASGRAFQTEAKRAVLHEVVHLLQLAASDPPKALTDAALYLKEGQAELSRWISHVDEPGLQTQICADLRGERPALLAHPYGLAVTLHTFLDDIYGSGVHRRLAGLLAISPSGVETLTGLGPPLTTAMVFANLALPCGLRGTCLRLGQSVADCVSVTVLQGEAKGQLQRTGAWLVRTRSDFHGIVEVRAASTSLAVVVVPQGQ